MFRDDHRFYNVKFTPFRLYNSTVCDLIGTFVKFFEVRRINIRGPTRKVTVLHQVARVVCNYLELARYCDFKLLFLETF